MRAWALVILLLAPALSRADGGAVRVSERAGPYRISQERSTFSHQEVDLMNYAETILPEFDREMANTRKVLERVPENKLDWQAHPRSHTIGWNANHLAEILGWVEGVLTAPSWDFAPVGGEPYQSPKLTSPQAILDLFDRNVARARKAIAAVKDDQMTQPWSLLKAGTPLFTMPRASMIRGFILNHLIHHRAILCVYLRLNDIPVPGMYGPSGDEISGW
jgi:uncharacterized damage-inducible protein DinB